MTIESIILQYNYVLSGDMNRIQQFINDRQSQWHRFFDLRHATMVCRYLEKSLFESHMNDPYRIEEYLKLFHNSEDSAVELSLDDLQAFIKFIRDDCCWIRFCLVLIGGNRSLKAIDVSNMTHTEIETKLLLYGILLSCHQQKNSCDICSTERICVSNVAQCYPDLTESFLTEMRLHFPDIRVDI